MQGVFAISVTPFCEDGEIDYRSLDSLVEFFTQKRVQGITGASGTQND
jgi:dihydrodipicolinate synthase/N-acetylneuraminate lyase